MASIKSKIVTAAVASVTAAAMLFGGTLAWTSISQQARNEAVVDINPGGRLHDDFDGNPLGIGGFANKDVYVENFSSGVTGVPIYARIRLDEYMEYGQDAGKDRNGSDRKVTVVDSDKTDEKTPNINDLTTWQTYIPNQTNTSTTIDFAKMLEKTEYTESGQIHMSMNLNGISGYDDGDGPVSYVEFLSDLKIPDDSNCTSKDTQVTSDGNFVYLYIGKDEKAESITVEAHFDNGEITGDVSITFTIDYSNVTPDEPDEA